MSQQPLLEVKELSKTFAISKGLFKREKQYLHAVNDVSFNVSRGEVLGIVGESGCGKSTTANLIMNLLEPTEGKVVFEGKNMLTMSQQEMRKQRSDIQMIFQDPFSSLNPRKRVFDIIAEPLITHRLLNKRELEKEVLELMDLVGLNRSFINRYPHEFSGGQRQRIGIARAIALQPKLIICDEPVSALDVSIQSQILNLLKELQKELNLTYIFIAHGLPVVKHISDRIAVMYLGEIVELTTKEQLFTRPMHPYTDGLLSAIPVPDPTQRKKERIIIEGDIPNPVDPPSGCKFHTRCPFATELCIEKQPVLEEKEHGHFVACHYPLKDSKRVVRNGLIVEV